MNDENRENKENKENTTNNNNNQEKIINSKAQNLSKKKEIPRRHSFHSPIECNQLVTYFGYFISFLLLLLERIWSELGLITNVKKG